MFENKKYLSSSERADMAKLLNVTEQQVKKSFFAHLPKQESDVKQETVPWHSSFDLSGQMLSSCLAGQECCEEAGKKI